MPSKGVQLDGRIPGGAPDGGRFVDPASVASISSSSAPSKGYLAAASRAEQLTRAAAVSGESSAHTAAAAGHFSAAKLTRNPALVAHHNFTGDRHVRAAGNSLRGDSGDQPRDKDGRFAGGAGSGASSAPSSGSIPSSGRYPASYANAHAAASNATELANMVQTPSAHHEAASAHYAAMRVAPTQLAEGQHRQQAEEHSVAASVGGAARVVPIRAGVSPTSSSTGHPNAAINRNPQWGRGTPQMAPVPRRRGGK